MFIDTLRQTLTSLSATVVRKDLQQQGEKLIRQELEASGLNASEKQLITLYIALQLADELQQQEKDGITNSVIAALQYQVNELVRQNRDLDYRQAKQVASLVIAKQRQNRG